MAKTYQDRILVNCNINYVFNNLYSYFQEMLNYRKATENKTLKSFTTNPVSTVFVPEVRNVEAGFLNVDQNRFIIQVRYGFSTKSYGEDVLVKMVEENNNSTIVYVQSTYIQKRLLIDPGVNKRNVNEILDFLNSLNANYNSQQNYISYNNQNSAKVVSSDEDIAEIKKMV